MKITENIQNKKFNIEIIIEICQYIINFINLLISTMCGVLNENVLQGQVEISVCVL